MRLLDYLLLLLEVFRLVSACFSSHKSWLHVSTETEPTSQLNIIDYTYTFINWEHSFPKLSFTHLLYKINHSRYMIPQRYQARKTLSSWRFRFLSLNKQIEVYRFFMILIQDTSLLAPLIPDTLNRILDCSIEFKNQIIYWSHQAIDVTSKAVRYSEYLEKCKLKQVCKSFYF